MSGRDPRARNREIDQAQLRGFARSFSEVEWLLLVLVTLYVFVTRPEAARDVYVVAVLIAFAVFIVVFRYSSILSGRTALKIGVEILVMIAFLTAVLALLGSDRAALTNLYLLPIITAALALGRRATGLVLGLVAACYVLLAVAEREVESLASLVPELASVLGPFVLVAFLTTLLAKNMQTAQARIRALADHDELTGVYNVRAFNKLADRHAEFAERAGTGFSLLIVDINQLKAINDSYGFEAGNRAIRLVADALLRLTRASDIIGRHGDDEFAVLLGDANRTIAEEVAQRIRNVVFATTLEIDSRIARIKVAVGAGTAPGDGTSLQQVMAAAEHALYKDKGPRDKPKGRLVFRKL